MRSSNTTVPPSSPVGWTSVMSELTPAGSVMPPLSMRMLPFGWWSASTHEERPELTTIDQRAHLPLLRHGLVRLVEAEEHGAAVGVLADVGRVEVGARPHVPVVVEEDRAVVLHLDGVLVVLQLARALDCEVAARAEPPEQVTRLAARVVRIPDGEDRAHVPRRHDQRVALLRRAPRRSRASSPSRRRSSCT